MRPTTPAPLLALAVAGLAALGLAGCSSGSGTEPTATETVTTTTSPSSTPTDDSSPTSSPSSSASAGSGSGSDTGSGTVTRCTTDELAATVASADGGAAGSTGVNLVLTNTGTTSCTLQGWPGVSLVGGGDGTQIGASATLDRSSAHGTVTLAPKSSAKALLVIAQAGNYDKATCKPTAADGFRVYPPGSKTSLYAKHAGVTACSSSSVKLLTVGALQ